MDELRNYLKNANVDVFEIIENAITVAASDHPNEFRIKRNKIVEALFSGDQLINSSTENKQDINNVVSHVSRIKGILEICGMHESETLVVCDLLNKLRDMGLTLEILKATGIGKTVGAFIKHESKDVKEIARMMIKDWKCMVDEYLDSEEKKSAVVQEKEELPMNKPQRSLIVRIKLKKTEVNVERDNNMPIKGPVTPEQKVENSTNAVAEVLKIKGVLHTSSTGDESKSESELMKMESSVAKPTKLNRNMNLEIDLKKANVNQKGRVVSTDDQQCKKAINFEVMAIKKNQKASSGGNIEEKVEATKRKLHQDYKMMENIKKKRKIQVVEFYELSKYGLLPPKDRLIKPVYKQFRKCSSARC